MRSGTRFSTVPVLAALVDDRDSDSGEDRVAERDPQPKELVPKLPPVDRSSLATANPRSRLQKAFQSVKVQVSVAKRFGEGGAQEEAGGEVPAHSTPPKSVAGKRNSSEFGHAWCARLQSCEDVVEERSRCSKSVLYQIEAIMPCGYTLAQEARMKIMEKVRTEVDLVLQRFASRALQERRESLDEFERMKLELQDMSARMTAMQSNFLKELSAARGRSKASCLDADATDASVVEIEYYDSLKYMTEDMRSVVVQVILDKIAKVFSKDPSMRERADRAQLLRIQAAEAQSKLQAAEKERDKCQEELWTLRNRLKLHGQNNDKMQEELAQSLAELKSAKWRIQELESDNESLRSEVSRLEKEWETQRLATRHALEVSNGRTQQLATVEKEREQLEQQVRPLEKKLASTVAQLEDYKGQVRPLQLEVIERRQENEQYQAEAHKAADMARDANKEVNKLRQQLARRRHLSGASNAESAPQTPNHGKEQRLQSQQSTGSGGVTDNKAAAEAAGPAESKVQSPSMRSESKSEDTFSEIPGGRQTSGESTTAAVDVELLLNQVEDLEDRVDELSMEVRRKAKEAETRIQEAEAAKTEARGWKAKAASADTMLRDLRAQSDSQASALKQRWDEVHQGLLKIDDLYSRLSEQRKATEEAGEEARREKDKAGQAEQELQRLLQTFTEQSGAAFASKLFGASQCSREVQTEADFGICAWESHGASVAELEDGSRAKWDSAQQLDSENNAAEEHEAAEAETPHASESAVCEDEGRRMSKRSSIAAAGSTEPPEETPQQPDVQAEDKVEKAKRGARGVRGINRAGSEESGALGAGDVGNSSEPVRRSIGSRGVFRRAATMSGHPESARIMCDIVKRTDRRTDPSIDTPDEGEASLEEAGMGTTSQDADAQHVEPLDIHKKPLHRFAGRRSTSKTTPRSTSKALVYSHAPATPSTAASSSNAQTPRNSALAKARLSNAGVTKPKPEFFDLAGNVAFEDAQANNVVYVKSGTPQRSRRGS